MQGKENVLGEWLAEAQQFIANQTMIKISLGGYVGEEPNLKQVHIKPVLIKRELKYSFVFRYQTKDITKNFSAEETNAYLLKALSEANFQVATLFSIAYNLILQKNKSSWKIRKETTSTFKPIELHHDKQKNRKLDANQKPYLHALGLTDVDGNVFKSGQDKFRQINHYIELLSSHLTDLDATKKLRVVDMGAGKGYLTFALYDYLQNKLKREIEVKGIEFRKDLVDLCNQIAQDSEFSDLKFEEGTIEGFQPSDDIDVLIALHACDTATDDAIAKGIQNNASLIVVAPCCHKQIRRELEASKTANPLDFMTKHGIFLERHAEMLTDAIRSLILEYFGYQTKVQQFISDAHTPKNVMIVATKKEISSKKQEEILNKLQDIKSFFGVNNHYLEKIIN
ncbi:class I SAM-dependent methyltransferase [Sphingobacterium hungaricum]|uniref:SAM-dependent methyltransferase n=1 Tax=Sphingobacterium hungaricum TaxID=2082723 RepID=A0A928YQ96_9SPHI|nr:SAM-dependent methyltransferase [Sphingobacterium hungaricum]MBE8712183.1 SAM-dependent methyltransferase [Sphingobacterium hungaricum]